MKPDQFPDQLQSKLRASVVTSSLSLTVSRTTQQFYKKTAFVWLSILTVANIVSFSSETYAADRCEIGFMPTPYFKVLGMDAQLSPQPERALEDYNRYLTTASAERPMNLIRLVPVNGLAIDAGGTGLAFHQLAGAKGLNALVVNVRGIRSARDLDPLDLQYYRSTFEYRVGHSEDVIKEFKNQASLITDVRGAFSDSPAKIELLETYYNALNANGTALIVYNPQIFPIRVKTSNGGTQDFALWLAEKFPSIVSVDRSAAPEHRNSLIIRMKRDPKIAELKIPLSLQSIDTRDFFQRPLGKPVVLYAE